MKNSTKQELINFISSHYLNEEYVIIDLFSKFYVEREFSSIDELLSGIDEFFNFLFENSNLFIFSPHSEFVTPIEKMIESAKEHILNDFSNSAFEGQKLFAKNINTMTNNKKLGRVLEVGSGIIPTSAFYLSKNAKRVTAMNPYFYFSLQAIKNMNVIPLQEMMNDKTDISDYDIIVGRAPCSAIQPIVKLCKETNKPYIILLCDCELDPKYKTNSDTLGWEFVLPKIDPNIKFYGRYALNFELTPEQLQNVVIDYTRVPLRDRKQGFWSSKSSEPNSRISNNISFFDFD